MLRDFLAIAAVLGFVWAPIGAAAADAYQRTIDLGAKTVEVQLQYAPGEGSVSTALPGDGQLTLRLPHLQGEGVALGNTQLAASYDLLGERQLLPSLGLVAHVDLPTATGTRDVRPSVKAFAEKRLDLGILEAFQLESEVWTDGHDLVPGYRTAFGTTLRLSPATRGSVQLIALRPGVAAGFARENLAQLGLSHRLDADTGLHAGVAARVAGDANSLSATIGFDRRF